MDSSKIGFTFWGNMKETVDRYQDPVLKYKIYDAITEYGLYGILPEEHDNMTLEEQTINAVVQSFIISLDKSRIYNETQQQKSVVGGKVKKIELEEIEENDDNDDHNYRRVSTGGCKKKIHSNISFQNFIPIHYTPFS